MSGPQKIKKVLDALPQIARYGSFDILLESTIKPQIKISMPSTINMLKRVAFHHKIISLSANQIGLDDRCFVALKPQIIKLGKWRNYGQQFQNLGIKTPEDAYQAIINPIEINSTFQHYYAYQQCPSFQGLKFKAKCPIFVNLKYLTEKVFNDFLNQNPISKSQTAQKNIANQMKPNNEAYTGNIINIPTDLYTTEKLEGFKGRVWDHQNRHLSGVLVIQQKVCNTQFYIIDDYKNTIQSIATYEQLLGNQIKCRKENLDKILTRAEKDMKQRLKYSAEQKKKENLLENFGGQGFPSRFTDIPDINPQKIKLRKINEAEMKKSQNPQQALKKQKINKHTKSATSKPKIKNGNK